MSLFHNVIPVEPGVHTWINLKVPDCWKGSSDSAHPGGSETERLGESEGN